MLGKKVSYMMGLLHGMELDATTKEGRAVLQMAEVMEEMAKEIERLQGQVNELTELCDIIDKDLGDVEYDLYQLDDDDDDDDEEDDEDDDDDDDDWLGVLDYHTDEDDDYDTALTDYDDSDEEMEQYEVTCPSCEAQIIINELMLEQGSMLCPHCSETLEFDYDAISETDGSVLSSSEEEE